MFDFMEWLTDERNRRRMSFRMAHIMPRWLILFGCWMLSALLPLLLTMGMNRQLYSNVKLVFTRLSRFKVNRLMRRYYYHVFLSIFELIIDSDHLQERENKIFRVSGESSLHEALQYGKGAIVYTPHLGNFFYYYWYLSQHYPCLAVATASDPKIRPIYVKFQAMGCQGIDYDETAPIQLFKILRNHLASNGIVFILGDFYRKQFPPATFFDYSTRAPIGAAVLALQHSVPVICMEATRRRGFTHQIHFHPCLFLDQMFEIHQKQNAAAFLHMRLEDIVRKQPAQWFYWFEVHQRLSSET